MSNRKYNLGGTRRTIVCGCGWSYCGIPDRLSKIINLHAKRCNLIDSDSIKQYTTTKVNGFINNSKDGSILKGIEFIDGIPIPNDFNINTVQKYVKNKVKGL